MRTWFSRHLTYANLVSTACLFILLGGTSYAALKITGKDVKPESLTGADIKDGSLLRKDLKKGEIPSSSGTPGPAGPQGAPGAQGAAGASQPQPATPTSVPQRLTLTRPGSPAIVFPVLSSSFGAENAGASGTGGGAGAGKTVFEDLVVTKPADASANELLLATAKGTHFASAKLELLAPGGSSPSATMELGATDLTGFSNDSSDGTRTQTIGLEVADPQNLTTNPPKLTWSPGAAALPLGEQKVGEMTITGLAGPIDIYSQTWGVKQTGTIGTGGGAGSGKSTFSDFNVTKALDASSPALLKELRSGKTFAKAEIKLLQPGSASLSSRYTLGKVRISGYDLSVDTSVLEELSIGYQRIEQFVPGPSGTELKTCWDVPSNAAC